MAKIVSLCWPTKPALSCMEVLNLKLWLKRGWEPHLWSYDHSYTEAAPLGVLRRDAAEILPLDSLFAFESPHGFLPGRGVGSLSQWSDEFMVALLHRGGGWWAQLDVSCLQDLPEVDWYFAPWGQHGVQSSVLKASCKPEERAWMFDALQGMRKVSNHETCRTMGWFDSLHVLTANVEKAKLLQHKGVGVVFEDFIADYYMQGTLRPGKNVHLVHWSNAYSGQWKRNPIPGTFYHQLLLENGLIENQQ